MKNDKTYKNCNTLTNGKAKRLDKLIETGYIIGLV